MKEANKQTNEPVQTRSRKSVISDRAKGDNIFSFGRALLLKLEARYTCGLAFAQGREEVFNTLIKSRLRMVHEVG